jgi:tetratricopeptide (TPR) repeat protein
MYADYRPRPITLKEINYFLLSEKTPAAEQRQKYSLLAMGEQEMTASSRLFPWDTETSYDLGGLYYRLGARGKAIETYTRAIELNFGYDEMFYMLGLSLSEVGRTAEAKKSFLQAQALNPNSEVYKTALAGLPKPGPK